MQIERTQNELIIRESPGCLWMFGLFFALIGGIFVYGALGGFVDFGSQPLWILTIAFLMGALAAATGIWLIYRAPLTVMAINRIDEYVYIKRLGLFGKRENIYYFDEIERFLSLAEKDGEGENIWSLAMILSDGEIVKISSMPSHDERFVRDFVYQTNEFSGRQLSVGDMMFEPEDESGAEMS